MLERIFVKEYFKNPFFWWGISILILTTFHANLIFNLTLQTIILHALYVPILFVCVTLGFFLTFYPIRLSLRKLLLKSETKKEALVYYALLCLVLIVQVMFFMSDTPVIFAKLQPQVITNREVFEEAIDLKMIMEYLAIPLLYAFANTIVKRKLLKEGYDINDKFRTNLKFGALLIPVNTAMYFLFILITSFQK